MQNETDNIKSKTIFQEELSPILQLMKSGKTDGVNELSLLLEKYPDNLEIMGHLWTAFAIKGEHQKAIDILTRYKELQPENLEAQWRIGDRLVNLGKLEEALETYKEILKENPDCMDANMGIRYVDYLKRRKHIQTETYIPKKVKLSERQESNWELNKKEFKELKLKLKSFPPFLFLEGTTKCNYYCRTCSKGYGEYYAEDLHPDIFNKVRQELMPTNVRISITGFGEPTLAKNFDEILQMCLENGSVVHFATNASLLNFNRIEKLTQYPVEVYLSIDGASKETFEEIRMGSNFELVCEKLVMVKKLRDIYLSKDFSLFSFLFVALNRNISELPDVVNMAHHYGINSILVLDYLFGYRDFDQQSLRYEPEKANYYLKEAEKKADELGIVLNLPPEYNPESPPPLKASLWHKILRTRRFFSEKKRFPNRCYSPWTEPYIRTDGTVSPCCTSGLRLGNLKKRFFEKIWNCWRYYLYRFRIHTSIPPLECRKCHLKWGLNGGNPGNVIAKEGLLVKAFYFFEGRLHRYGEKLIRFLRSLLYKLKGQEIPEPKPNYFRGRPIFSGKQNKREKELSQLL